MATTLVEHPVEAGLDGQPCQHADLRPILVRRHDVDGAPFVVQRLGRMHVVLVPALGHHEPQTGPLVHHRDGQYVELFFAALRERDRERERAK